MRASMKWPMRALAMTGMWTVRMISSILPMLAMRATPPSLRISAGTRSSAITAQAPASSAILAWSALVTSMMTPPLSISARPTFNRNCSLENSNIVFSLKISGWQAEPPAPPKRTLHHRARGLVVPGGAFHLARDNSSQNCQAAPDLVRSEARKTQPQCSRLEPGYRKVPAGQISHTFLLRPRQKLARIQGLGQPHPHVHSALGPCPARGRPQGPAAGAQGCRQPLGAGLEHARAVGLEASGLRELEQHRLGKLVGMQIGGLLGLAQAVDEGLRPHHPAHPQPRETHLGKAAEQHGAAVLVQLLEGRQRLAFIAELTIGVVFHYRYVRRAGGLEQLVPGRQGQGCARGVLEIRGHHQEPRA